MPFDIRKEDAFIEQDRPADPFEHRWQFRPVVVRNRHDGWTEAKQGDFLTALGECGCVADACRRVGMSTESAYKLRARADAIDFRLTWAACLDYAVDRIEDAALSRAIHGVAEPRFYKGQQVGEVRRFDERLTQFLLRYRKPTTYARHWDRMGVIRGHPEEDAEAMAAGIARTVADVSRYEIETGNIERIEAYAKRAADRANHYSQIPGNDPIEAEILFREYDSVADHLEALQAAFDDEMRPHHAAYVAKMMGRDAAAPGASAAAAADVPAVDPVRPPIAPCDDYFHPDYIPRSRLPEWKGWGDRPWDVVLPSSTSGDAAAAMAGGPSPAAEPRAARAPVADGMPDPDDDLDQRNYEPGGPFADRRPIEYKSAAPMNRAARRAAFKRLERAARQASLRAELATRQAGPPAATRPTTPAAPRRTPAADRP